METDINKIRKLSKKNEEENWEFRAFLKECDIPSKKIDIMVNEIYKKISSEIDCRKCANCCKRVQPVLQQSDIKKLSPGLGITSNKFKEEYLVYCDDTPGYTFNQLPCPFLKNNMCLHYKYRPDDCRSYPHLHKKGFVFRLMNVINNCSICPIVFNVYEQLKEELFDERFSIEFEDLDSVF